MDMSSQTNLAGYVTVILALQPQNSADDDDASRHDFAGAYSDRCRRRWLAGDRTAKRLGARGGVRYAARGRRQVQSLGAKFVQIDLGETGQTAQGYARELTPEQLELQREGMKKVIGAADVVITTAQVFGRPAPRIVTLDMVEGMRPGSVVVDMAVESGGNVEGSVVNEVIDINGVIVVGLGNLTSQVSRNASEMYSSNIVNLLTEFWDTNAKVLNLKPEDDIVKGCVITRDGAIVNETIKALMR
jgi:NAD(P) transhydrogenase subunit alpha